MHSLFSGLTDILYRATANHYWTFRDTSADRWIVDGGPKQNQLSEAVYTRFDEYDAKLIQPGPIHDDVDNSERSIFVALQSKDKPQEGTRFLNALGIDPERSVQLTPGDVNEGCIKLVDSLQQERYYLRQCLLSATNCDYGLSLAVWLRFLSTEVASREIIIATGPENARGFQLFIENGELRFELWTNTLRWSIGAPYIKRLNQWTNIGVIWGKSTETLKLLVNKIVLAEKTHYTGQAILGVDMDPSALWLGCTVNENGMKISQSTTYGLEISSVTLWYWPLQSLEYITGGKELYLLGTKPKPPVPEPPEIVPDYVDYTNMMEELVPLEGLTYPPNPMYLAADYYHSMQDELDAIQTNDATRNWEPMRKMYAYALTGPDGFIKLKTFDNPGCPTSLAACVRGGGLSIGVWMQIPSGVLPSDYPVDVLELVGVLRVAIFKGTLNIFVTHNNTQSAFRIVDPAPLDTWFNLGVSVRNSMKVSVEAYFNAFQMPTQEVVNPATDGQPKPIKFSQCLLVGGQTSKRSATNVAVNDLTIWHRALNDFEAHRFVGYTYSQMKQLQLAAYYWTPDLYVLRDSSVQLEARNKYKYFGASESGSSTGVDSYALASIYKPLQQRFRYSTLDHENKSPVPIFDMKPQQYMMLGRRKSKEVLIDNLLWLGECLHDPGETFCGSRGFSLSIWMKIISVSTKRLRFYLNSGDSGINSVTLTDHRGVAVFTDASLLGVSLSQRLADWKLVLDSNSYEEGCWINIGILWNEDMGLTMLVDGVNYGTNDLKGNKVYKERVGPPYVTLGRFDSDDQSLWLSPSQAEAKWNQSDGRDNPSWEMANFALGEVTYFKKRLTEDEYRDYWGFPGVSHYRRFNGHLWFGINLVDANVDELLAAAKKQVNRPGPILSSLPSSNILLLQNPTAAQLSNGSSLRLGILDENHCTRQTNFCPEGLSAGSWIRLGGPSQLGSSNVHRPLILFTGAGGKFGMTINYTADELGAWVQIKFNSTTERSWWCRASGSGLRGNTANMQWMHYGIAWGPQPDSGKVVLHIFLNGMERTQCSDDDHNGIKSEFGWVQVAASRAARLYGETETDREAYILLSADGLEPADATMSVALMALTPTTLTGSSVMKLLGLDYNQYLTFHISTFYWPLSGFFSKLTPWRITPLRVAYAYNSQDVYAGAMCTDGTNQSYIALSGDLVNTNGKTNLEDACIINPTKCQSYVFIMEFKQSKRSNSEYSPSSDVDMELFRTAPINAPLNTVGLTVAISSDGQRLLVTARSEFRTLSNSVPLTAVNMSNKWMKLEIIYTEKLLVIRDAGVILASSINGSLKMEQNQPLSSIETANLQIFVGRGYPICVSEVATIDVPVGEDPESLINSGTAVYCHPESDFLLELRGMETDHVGLKDAAQSLQELVNPLSLSQTSCLYNPNICEQGSFTLSIWIRVDSFKDSTETEAKPNIGQPLSAVLFSTGPPANRGLLIKVIQRMTGGKIFLDLQVEVQTSTDRWLINSPNVLQLGQWTNLGVNWQAAIEMKSGNLEIYSNGMRQRSSTLPQSSVTVPVNISTEPGLYFNRAFLTKMNPLEQTEQYFIDGAVNHLSFWEPSPISCARPRSTKQKLLGLCSPDLSVPDKAVCTVLRDCLQADGAVCLDPTMQNLHRMANQAGWLSDPRDFQRLLNLALEIAQTLDLVQQGADDLKDFLETVLVIMQQWPRALDSACDITPSEYCTTLSTERDSIITLLLQLNALISRSAFEIAWDELLQMGKTQPTVITNIVNGVMLATGNTLETLLNCQQMHSTSTDVGVAVSVAVNMESRCAGLNVSATSKSLLNNVTLGQATFSLPSSAFGKSNQQAATGLVTLMGIPATTLGEKFVAGGLKKSRFSKAALDGPLGLKNSSKLVTTLNLESLLKSTTALQIQSPVYVFDVYRSDGTRLTDNTLVSFMIELSEPNEYEDVYFYRTTGRRIWKAHETMTTHELGRTGQLMLAYPVRCVYWTTDSNGAGLWDTSGCSVATANLTHVFCTCSHASVFAVAVEPRNAEGRRRSIWNTWGVSTEEQHTFLMRVLLLSTNALSLGCSLVFLFTLIAYLCRRSFQDIYIIHVILCCTFVLLHTALLMEPLVERTKLGCRTVGLFLHMSGVLTTSWLFCETIALFRCFVLGDFSSTRFWTWLFGVIAPLTVVLLPVGLSRLSPHGDDLLCFPAHESFVFWSMIGFILVYLSSAIIVCLIIGCNIETPAYLKPKLIEKLIQTSQDLSIMVLPACDHESKMGLTTNVAQLELSSHGVRMTHLRFPAFEASAIMCRKRVSQLNFLIIFTTVCWVAVVLVMKSPIPYLPYIAFGCLSLQGTLVFLLLGLSDVDLLTLYCGKYSDYSGSVDSDNTDQTKLFNTLSRPADVYSSETSQEFDVEFQQQGVISSCDNLQSTENHRFALPNNKKVYRRSLQTEQDK
ncbi:hypothetical protein P879_02726 [Paragonimus westermani]|uniref:GAIN-B domain-containing protein n=1 Tax=Paragonimus westermani TaxID=34504 RepID=A0A8T0DRD5_9TREM|nr:hypothetical protein P879_02726 [Paragonimus westermani]